MHQIHAVLAKQYKFLHTRKQHETSTNSTAAVVGKIPKIASGEHLICRDEKIRIDKILTHLDMFLANC